MTRKSGIRYIVIFIAVFTSTGVQAGQLKIGTATADITPKLPVALEGQFNLRIADTVETPLSASVLVLESEEDNRSSDMAVMVSCDLLQIPSELLDSVRKEVHRQSPEIDVMKIFLNAIHTHTAPVVENRLSAFRYAIPENGLTQVEEYNDFFIHRVAGAIVKAWKGRQPGSMSWGLSHAVVGYNRRVVYSKPVTLPGNFANGTAEMYGNTNAPEFMNLEGTEDHDVNVLFFWDRKGKPVAMAIDIPCPAQQVESRSAVNADYWYPVREKLRQEFGSDLCVLGWISAAGDQSPHPVYRQAAENRMTSLRHLDDLHEISRRIVYAVEEAYNTVSEDRHADVRLIHRIEKLDLPVRQVTETEYACARSVMDTCKMKIASDPRTAADLAAMLSWNEDVVRRYEKQKTSPDQKITAELHIIRLGDVAVCTNPFELFTDYGIRMKARSRSLQTFIVQLAGDGTYLPTEKAVAGGGYSAIIQSDVVSPAGGQRLVDRTIEVINSLFP